MVPSGPLIAFHVAGPVEDIPRHRLGSNAAIVLDYWTAKRGKRSAPERRDFDPMDVPLALPCLLLWDVPEGGAQIVWRLAGQGGRDKRDRLIERNGGPAQLAQHAR